MVKFNQVTTINDCKTPVDTTANDIADFFNPTVLQWYEYYPFGMIMFSENYGDIDYRFGFGGHELDNEIKGAGNHYSFGDFGYDPRLGRRWNLDPMVHEFPWMSPYATYNDNPILFIDPDGNNPVIPVLWGWAKRKVVMESAKAILRRVTETVPTPPGAIPKEGSSVLVMPQDKTSLPLPIENKLEVDTEKVNEQSKAEAKRAEHTPDRELPRDRHGNPVPDPDASGAHTQLGKKEGRHGPYRQAR